jgi:hypothetical protein
VEIIPYSAERAEAWDAICATGFCGTFLHTRRFLGYHGTRFRDASVMIYDDAKLVGVMPAAVDPNDARVVVSHPGATYGGVVHEGRLLGSQMITAWEALIAHYAGAGFERMVYRPVPHIYARQPAHDDLYALFRVGAARVRCDLNCAVDLEHRRSPSERRRRSLKKALRAVVLDTGPELLEEFYEVLQTTLEREHGVRPVHTIAELAQLQALFPEQVLVRAARVEGRVHAGVVFFNAPMAWHAQYIASSETGYSVSALDAVFDAAIEEARIARARWFDFGTSNEDAGRVLNDGLYKFKSEFGGSGVAHETYVVELSRSAESTR